MVVAGLVPGLLAIAGPVRAAPDLTPVFAVCTGRMSAVVEHRWLMQRDPAEAEADYAAMGGLLEAVTGPETESVVMGWRVAAKVAMRGLLERADLQGDMVAGDRAADLIADCRRLIGAPGA